MTRASLREYAMRQQERYALATTRAQKRALLDEIVAVARIHRKAAIRLLRRMARPAPARAGPGDRATTARRWPPPPRSCGRRPAASAPIACSPSCRSCLIASPSAANSRWPPPSTSSCATPVPPPSGACSRPPAARYPVRGATTTHPGTWLKQEIPIRTFTDWDDARPGFLEIDLVAHCGSSTLGRYLCTLCAVDIVTCWVELEAVLGKGQARVGAAVQHVHARLPVPLLGLDSDNGSEFINRGMYAYCQRHAITFTRSRAWKKNDSAHVEQKNGAIVRGLVGYDRYYSKAAYAQLARVYRLARLHVNFFQPVQKLVRKTRAGARTRRYYDTAQTPYQRLCAAGVLAPGPRADLDALYASLNPAQLRRDLDRELERLWRLAAPDPLRPPLPPLAPAPPAAPGGA